MSKVRCQVPTTGTLEPANIGFFGAEKKTVSLDPFSLIPESEFPFDRYFYIRRYYKAADQPVKFVFISEPIYFRRKYIKNLSDGLDPTGSVPALKFGYVKSDVADKYPEPSFTKAIDILVPPLQPRGIYDLVFKYPMTYERRVQLTDAFIAYYNGDKGGAKKIIDAINKEKKDKLDSGRIRFEDFELYFTQYALALLPKASLLPDNTFEPEARNALIASLDNGGELLKVKDPDLGEIRKLLFLDVETLTNQGTEAFKVETRAGAKLQPDFGAVFYGLGGNGSIGVNDQFWGVNPYVGVAFMVRSFDADIPIRFVKRRISPLQRLSVHAGVTLISLVKDNYRENLLGKNNLMLGLGYRLTSVLKIQGGVILYKKRTDANPLYTNTVTAPIGYFGLSLDLRIRNILGDIGKVIFGS
jgi:hypothetical protein